VWKTPRSSSRSGGIWGEFFLYISIGLSNYTTIYTRGGGRMMYVQPTHSLTHSTHSVCRSVLVLHNFGVFDFCAGSELRATPNYENRRDEGIRCHHGEAVVPLLQLVDEHEASI